MIADEGHQDYRRIPTGPSGPQHGQNAVPLREDGEKHADCRVAVIVAHPDDETLWAGGLLLSTPIWKPFIVSLCRGGDPDRAPRFFRVLERLNAHGAMGDLDDGPDQQPLPDSLVRATILSLLPGQDFDLLLTHAPNGEYTRHRRHEEVARAVMDLWRGGRIHAGELLQFAYEDGGGSYTPRPRKDATHHLILSDDIWTRKYEIITGLYGFGTESWEARSVTRTEAFQCYGDRKLKSCSV